MERNIVLVKGILCLWIGLGISSCVSSKKYQEMEAKYEETSSVEKETQNELKLLKTENQRLTQTLEVLKRENLKLQDEIIFKSDMSATEVNRWRDKYANLKASYDELLQNSTLEASTHRQQLKEKSSELEVLKSQQPLTEQNIAETQVQIENNDSTTISNSFSVNQVDKGYYTTSVENTLEDNKRYNASKNTTLYDLQGRIVENLKDFEKSVEIAAHNGNIYIHILDELLFRNANYDLSNQGIFALQHLSQIIKNYQKPVHLSIEGEAYQADGNPSGYQKAQSIAGFLKEEALDYSFHKKSFAPLAFETTGTQTKTPKTSLIISFPEE